MWKNLVTFWQSKGTSGEGNIRERLLWFLLAFAIQVNTFSCWIVDHKLADSRFDPLCSPYFWLMTFKLSSFGEGANGIWRIGLINPPRLRVSPKDPAKNSDFSGYGTVHKISPLCVIHISIFCNFLLHFPLLGISRNKNLLFWIFMEN